MVDHLDIRSSLFDPGREPCQDLLDVGTFVGHDDAGDDRQDVVIVLTDLGGRQIELPVQGCQQGLETAALLLERAASGQAELESQGADVHRPSVARQVGVDKTRRPCQNGVMRVMRRIGPWIGVLVLILVVAFAAYLVTTTVRQATQPVAALSAGLGTQIAEILHPTPTILPDPVTIVREVRSLARLETIQYTVEKVITAETGQGPFGFLFGDRLLLVAHGVVIAGVDLGRVEPTDVWFDEAGRVYLRLPAPEIFVATLDNNQSYVYDRDTGLLTSGDVNLEAAARRAAEEEIRQAALRDGILDQARLNAESVLYRLLRSLGFGDVIFAPAGAGPALPPTSTPTALPTPAPAG